MPSATGRAPTIRHLGPDDVADLQALIALFGRAFEDPETYAAQPPEKAYLGNLLGDKGLIALVAYVDDVVVGGLVAYVLHKVEQQRSEVYIYDLAVDMPWRRRGIATALIEALKPLARQRGACVIYVQADRDDDPAIALYSGLGSREDVLHFDLPVD